MQERSSRVLGFIADLHGLTDGQLLKLRQVVWVLANSFTISLDDIVQEVALTAWVGQLTGARADFGTLIAAANRAAAGERRR